MPTTLYIKTIEHNPTAWLAYNNLAMLSLARQPPSKEELEKGLAGFRQAMVLAPKEPLVQFNVGTALYRLKRREEALAVSSCRRQRRTEVRGSVGQPRRLAAGARSV